MRYLTEGMEPKRALQYFEEICGIPHGSGNESALAQYIIRIAEESGLETEMDRHGNVLGRLASSPGAEEAPFFLMQGHMDMVCEKEDWCDLDMEKEPVRLRREGNILWSYAPAEEIPERALTAECTRELLDFLLFTPTGALKRHHLNPHQVLGSALIKCADLKDGVFTGNYTIRSNTDPYKYLLAQKFCRLCDRYGVIWKKTGDDPAWPENPVSSLTKLCLDVYEKRFGCKPACELVHGGEEASIVSYCIPDMEIVGIAPYSRGAHTPKERLYLDTVLPVWQFLTDLLAQLSER